MSNRRHLGLSAYALVEREAQFGQLRLGLEQAVERELQVEERRGHARQVASADALDERSGSLRRVDGQAQRVERDAEQIGCAFERVADSHQTLTFFGRMARTS